MSELERNRLHSFEAWASLSKRDLEDYLTDISAERYLLEAKRLRTRRQITAFSGARTDAERLVQQDRQIGERLEELHARTAAVRGRLEQLRVARA